MPQMPHMRRRGAGRTETGTPDGGTVPGSVPDQRLAGHDDPTTTTRPDDGTPLA
jgi:hypothetical protein